MPRHLLGILFVSLLTLTATRAELIYFPTRFGRTAGKRVVVE